MATKLFIGSLSWDTTDEKLRDFFAQAGTVVSANVITDKFTGRSKGFGFVEMSSDAEAHAATEQLNGQMLDGRKIVVNEARPMQPRDNPESYPQNQEKKKNYEKIGNKIIKKVRPSVKFRRTYSRYIGNRRKRQK